MQRSRKLRQLARIPPLFLLCHKTRKHGDIMSSAKPTLARRARDSGEKCCNPECKPGLLDSFNRAERLSYGKHSPSSAHGVTGWHGRYLQRGDWRRLERETRSWLPQIVILSAAKSLCMVRASPTDLTM